MSTKVPLYMCLSHMPSSHPHPIQTCLSHLCPSHVPLSPTHEQHLSTTKTVRGTIQTFKTHSRKFFCSKQSRSMSIKKRIYKHWCQTLHDLVLTALLQNTQKMSSTESKHSFMYKQRSCSRLAKSSTAITSTCLTCFKHVCTWSLLGIKCTA